MAEGDQISTESKDGISVGMEYTGNEEGKASDQGGEKDTTSREEEREQSLETYSDTGMYTLYSSEDYH